MKLLNNVFPCNQVEINVKEVHYKSNQLLNVVFKQANNLIKKMNSNDYYQIIQDKD